MVQLLLLCNYRCS